MRRRTPTMDLPVPPPHLVRFDPDDWPVGDRPCWWRDAPDEYPWRVFTTRVQWLRARRAWVAEQGGSRKAREALTHPGQIRPEPLHEKNG